MAIPTGFFSEAPQTYEAEFVKPRERITSETGLVTQIFTGVGYWSGNMGFKPRRTSRTEQRGHGILGELQDKDRAGGWFFMDLTTRVIPLDTAPTWTAISGKEGYGKVILAGYGAGVGRDINAGDIISFRSSRKPNAVTSRIVVKKESVTFQLTPGWKLTLNFPLEPILLSTSGQVCTNRPHIRAQLLHDSASWQLEEGFMHLKSVAWVEDTAGNAQEWANLRNEIAGGNSGGAGAYGDDLGVPADGGADPVISYHKLESGGFHSLEAGGLHKQEIEI